MILKGGDKVQPPLRANYLALERASLALDYSDSFAKYLDLLWTSGGKLVACVLKQAVRKENYRIWVLLSNSV